jgi:prepilin-type N-terminal cleavage/methylation domain-containing protein/prepilin-type processing-associated H-X9-DG protein
MSSSRKAGFTLVELLVVIAIIGILVGLLLPAVQAAREAARRMQCQNKLKQFGLAVQGFHDVNLNFPPGMTDDDTDNFGWGAYILPYIEQQALYDKINGVVITAAGSPPARFPINGGNHPNVDSAPWNTLQINHGSQNVNTRQVLTEFLCPSNPQEVRDNDSYGASHYVGNGGNYITSTVTNATPFTASAANMACGAYRGNVMNGVFLHDGNNDVTYVTKMANMTDGTSSTMLIGEIGASATVNVSKTDSPHFPLWAGGNNNGGCVSYYMSAAMRFGGYNFTINRAITDPNSDLSFGSYHNGGAQFVLVDGSVKFFTSMIDTDIYAYVAQRNDGISIKLP